MSFHCPQSSWRLGTKIVGRLFLHRHPGTEVQLSHCCYFLTCKSGSGMRWSCHYLSTKQYFQFSTTKIQPRNWMQIDTVCIFRQAPYVCTDRHGVCLQTGMVQPQCVYADMHGVCLQTGMVFVYRQTWCASADRHSVYIQIGRTQENVSVL